MWPGSRRAMTITAAIGGAVSVKCLFEKESYASDDLVMKIEKNAFVSPPTLGGGHETAYLSLIHLCVWITEER